MRPLNISGSQAKNYYYEKDPIFSKDQNSKWHGAIAKEFNLQGRSVQKPAFLNLVSGSDPNGNQIVGDGVNGEHRAAVDIPFSAPKSVSIMALHVGDKQMLDAHIRAVESTIDYIEKNYIYARKTIKKNTFAFKTGNGLFATFQHSASRENDPQLHTHTLTFNMTRTDDGWRALFNDRIFKDQALLNSIYQSHLAKNVQDLGFGIVNSRDVKWEIAGVKKEWIKTFSKRSKKIDQAESRLKEQQKFPDSNETVRRNLAVLESRKSKDKTISKDQLKSIWQDQIDRELIQKSVQESTKNYQKATPELPPEAYIQLAYEAIHENESTFKKKDVINYAMNMSRGEYTIYDIENAFKKRLRQKDIVHLVTLKNSKGLETSVYTSAEMKKTEEQIIETFRGEKETVSSALDSEFIQAQIEKNYAYFTSGQKETVAHILSSTQRFMIIQGDAGTGKTTAMKAVNEIFSRSQSQSATSNYPPRIIALGYTGKAAMEIEKESGIASQTLHKFLNSSASGATNEPQIWIVDESSMVGSRQMKALMDKALKENAKLAFVGDGKQLQAISAGKMFKDLQKYGHVQALKMEKVLRQKTAYMQEAVGHIKQFQDGNNDHGINKAFDILSREGRVKIIENPAERIEKAADYFIQHPDRKNILIVTPKNIDRNELNDTIRVGLKAKNQISQEDFKINIKRPVSLPGTSRYFADSYKTGQMAFVEKQMQPDATIKAGQEVTIVAKDIPANTLTVEDANGNKEVVQLKTQNTRFSLYDLDNREFSAGDKIVFLKNDNRLKVQNGLTASIEKIDASGYFSVKIDAQDRTVTFNKDNFAYIDLGYAVTAHKSQGQTAKEVVFVTDSQNEFLNKSEFLYVALTRAAEHASLYVDDPRKLQAQFMESQGKTSVIESLNQQEVSKTRNYNLAPEPSAEFKEKKGKEL